MANLWRPKRRPAAPGGVSLQAKFEANRKKKATNMPQRAQDAWAARYSRQSPSILSRGQQADADRYTAQGKYWMDKWAQEDTGAGGGGGGGGGWEDWGGGGGGGGGAPAPITWSAFDSDVAGPSWWKAMKPSEINEGTEAVAAMNMLIPFLSPEDQKTVAANIYGMNAADFGHLNPEGIKVAQGTEMNQGMVNQYTSTERAEKALAAMTALAKAAGKDDKGMGTGYRYLRSILDAGKQFGGKGGAGQTRRQYQQMMSALDPLLAQTKDPQLGAYASLANMLARPYFNQGQLTPMSKTQTGEYVFGKENKALL
jgi:hypothetical protein